MKITFHPLKAMLALTLCCTASSAALAQQDAHEQALRELNIMRNIFGAALLEDGNRGGFQRSGPEALYLADQGMVFTFDLPDGGRIFFNMESLKPLVNLGQGNFDAGDFDFDFDFDFDYEGFDGNDAALNEQASAYREQLRAMNEQLRDRQQELRDVQRQLREVQRSNTAANEDEIARLETELEAQSSELEDFSNSYARLQQEFETERDAAVAERRDQQTLQIFDTLCIYGNTLRSLASGQHVSLVLRNFADGQSQVYVLDQADIVSCSAADSLRESAVSYQIPG